MATQSQEIPVRIYDRDEHMILAAGDTAGQGWGIDEARGSMKAAFSLMNGPSVLISVK